MKKVRISTYPLTVTEYVPGVKSILTCFDGTTQFTVDKVKELFKKHNNRELDGNSFRNWIYIPDRGYGWDFDEIVIFHSASNMLQYLYSANEDNVNRTYLKNCYI